MGGTQKVYASVKSFSQRGKLLTKSDLQVLAESRDLDELITRIKNTIYSDATVDITKPYTSEKIESALRSYLADVHYSIAKSAGDSDILDSYYLKFLIWNLKAILKGKVLGRTSEEIEPSLNLHAEELIKQRDVTLKALVAKDLEETVASLSSIQFGDEITKAVTLYNESKNIQVFDTYFDKILYLQLGRAIKNTRNRDVIRLVGMDIDFYNLLSVIRGKFWNLNEQQIQDLIITQTASVPKELLAKMISAASIKDAFNEILTTRYKELVPQIENELDAIAEFERRFELAIFKACNSSFTKMFNFATIIGITKLTAYEVRNMAAIVYAVEQKIPTETIMSKLITKSE
jgi:V/A-type H+-transporting ATPase subunit C